MAFDNSKNIIPLLNKQPSITMGEVKNKIKKLGIIRKNVPQFLFTAGVDTESSIAIREAIIIYKTENPDVNEIDFIINSPGGLAHDAYRIIRTLRHSFATVNVIVPFWAKSAATLLSLGANKIVMDDFGEFGPLDAQVVKKREDSPEFDRESALNDEHSINRIETRFKEMFESMFIRIYEHKKINISKSDLSNQLMHNLSKFYEPLLSKIDPYKLGEKRRSLDIGAHYARRILLQFNSIEVNRARLLVDFLVDGCPDHGYIIDYDLLCRFLPNIVITAKQFADDEYAITLRDISLLFMNSEDEDLEDFIGFIEPDPLTAEKILNEDKKDGLVAPEIMKELSGQITPETSDKKKTTKK